MLRLRIGTALGLLVAIVASASAQDKVNLTWKFEKDKPFYQEMTTKTTQSIKVMGMDVNQVQEQTFYFKWTPMKQEGDKWVLRQTIEGVKMKIDIAGNPISFDSTSSNPAGGTGGANTALSEFFKALVGSEFTLTLNTKTMKVEKIEGREEFLKKLGSANQAMEPLLKRILSDEALKQMADPTFGMFPGGDKKVGDTWKVPVTLNLGPIGSYENTYTYTFKGKDPKSKDLDRIEVEATLNYKPPTDSAEGLPFKIKSADLKSKDKQTPGVVLFNPKTGRLVSSDMTVKLGGTLEIEIGNTTAKVELQQDQTTAIKTADKSFLPEKK